MLNATGKNFQPWVNYYAYQRQEKAMVAELLRAQLYLPDAESDPVEVDDNLSSKSQSNLDESVYIVGGFDGSSWSSSLESYSPFKDTRSSLNSMQFVKKYASAAILNGELYHFGGEGFHTVGSFIPSKNQWVQRSPLFWKNIHVAGASVKDRLFVVGGANGRHCSSEVEYLDLDIGKWIPTCPMLSKVPLSSFSQIMLLHHSYA
ncbi:hypothetical protein CTI12_AA411480 [Artemisia annua]|uniref:Uncharacterized protein n=1 Tax=Artemisia annua TaxID=35608 RepID=A0A2U1M7I0_ARTAN|nr:hypothetical protein CTI12_AA411480 [Artemisia annua]